MDLFALEEQTKYSVGVYDTILSCLSQGAPRSVRETFGGSDVRSAGNPSSAAYQVFVKELNPLNLLGNPDRPKKVVQIEKKIEKIKQQLQGIGEMRPGSLTLQYQKPKEKKGEFYQISYTHHMKSKTQHDVRPEFVEDLQSQIKEYKKFKALITEWVDLAIEHSILKIQIAKEAGEKVL